MLAATKVARATGHCHETAASSWKPKKWTTRQVATASIGDHELPPSAAVTWAIRAGTASFSVSALANSWATRASVGDPANTVVAEPAAPNVQPVPTLPGIAPHTVEVSPMLQLHVGPGSMPPASTSATRVATEGPVYGRLAGTGTAAGAATGTAAGAAVGARVGAGVATTGATVVVVVVGAGVLRRAEPGAAVAPWPADGGRWVWWVVAARVVAPWASADPRPN